MIDQATIDRIMDAAQIVDVVSEFVTLRRRGVNFVGLCPFHDDKNPSFYVSPAKGLCKCFACGKGGNSVHFIMEHEQLSFPEALKFLARKYHIEITERELSSEELTAQNERESMFVVNQFACDHFCRTLRQSDEGRSVGMAYLRTRGFRDDIIEKFRLGYCSEKTDDLAREAFQQGYREEYLLRTGLCMKADDHRLRDRFHGRVIFPIHTLSGKVAGFGGRVLASATKGVRVKYINSPESEVYHKGNELYGIFFARQAIMKNDRCFLVEGYTDVISMHQADIENVVASSGTALTAGQIRLIRRFTRNITVLYDGDAAGIKASLRGIDLLLEEGMNVKVCLLPDGDDPDSFARQHTSEEFQAFLAEHETDFIRFKTCLLLEEAGKDPIKRAELIGSLVQSISVIPEAIVRDVYVKECAQLLHVEDKLLVQEVAKRRETQAKQRAEREARRMPQPPTVDAPMPQPDNITEGTPVPAPTTAAEYTPPVVQRGREEQELYDYERLIMQVVVRYGEREMCTIADEEGTERTVTVVEYVTNELQIDDLTFHNPLHRRMLADAADRLHDSGFVAEHYFSTHPDPDISRLSADLISIRYSLSKYHSKQREIVTDEKRLHELVPMLMVGFKNAVVAEELKRLMNDLHDPTLGEEQCNALMQRCKELRELQSLMAQRLGDRVVLH